MGEATKESVVHGREEVSQQKLAVDEHVKNGNDE